MVWGPGDFQHRVGAYLGKMDAGEPVELDPALAPWRGARGYVDHMADALMLAASHPAAPGKVYNVADEPELSELAWVEAIGRAAGGQGAPALVPAPEPGMDLAQEWVLDSRRIRAELGYRETVPFDEGLRRAVAWERAQP